MITPYSVHGLANHINAQSQPIISLPTLVNHSDGLKLLLTLDTHAPSMYLSSASVSTMDVLFQLKTISQHNKLLVML